MKTLGSSFVDTDDWKKIMKDLLIAKFEQNKAMLDKLLSTGDELIIGQIGIRPGLLQHLSYLRKLQMTPGKAVTYRPYYSLKSGFCSCKNNRLIIQ